MDKPITSFSGQYEFLSNFYLVRIYDGDLDYPSVEHAYQAAKTTSAFYRRQIAAAPTPGMAKRLGRTMALRPRWDETRREVMLDLLRIKFTPGTLLAQALLDTGDAELIEGNHWHDYYWGVCNGRGKNWLGKLLMQVREELKAEQGGV